MNSNLYIKSNEDEFIIVFVYVDDIMFGSNKYSMVQWFSCEMKSELEMSIIGELSFYLGLQILQKSEGIFILREISKRYFENFQNEGL